MPVKLPEVEALGMNMTPMIDIVFNLVQFFMLTLDLSHKELAVLDLPQANNGVEDKDPSLERNKPKEDTTRFIINLEVNTTKDPKTGREYGPCIYFRGNRYPVGSDRSPQEQDNALNNLRKDLISLHNDPQLHLRDKDGTSRLMILVRGDRTAKWQFVQWIMQVCADPALKIWKIHFAVEHPKKD